MFKLWLKIMSVLTLIVTVLADNESICKEIKKLLIAHGDENQSFGLCYLDYDYDIDPETEIIKVEISHADDEELSYDNLIKIFSYIDTVTLSTDDKAISENVINALKASPNIKKVILSYSPFPIPSSFLEIDNIKILELNRCTVDKDLIDGLSKMSNLEELYFIDTSFAKDYSPSNTTNSMTSLKKFEYFNTMCGSDDKDNIDFIFGAKNLEYLKLDCSCLTGISEKIGNLKSLKELYIKYYYHETLPEQIFDLVNLETLEVRSTSLKEFPKQIFNLKNLKKLNLLYNGFDSIPEEIGSMESLEVIDFTGNHIKEIPKEIGNLKNLKILNLYYNKIENLIEELGNLENLEELYINKNRISELPSSLNNLKKLKILVSTENYSLKGKILTNESLETCKYDEDNYELCKPIENIKCLNDDIKDVYKLCSDENIVEKSTETDDKPTSTEVTEKPTNTSIEVTEKPTNTSTAVNEKPTNTSTEVTEKPTNTSTTVNEKPTNTSTDNIEKPTDIDDKPVDVDDDTSNNTEDIDDSHDESDNESGNESTTDKNNDIADNDSDDTKISNNGKCGKGYGKCPDDYCCSKYGWCGKSKDYCSTGCQSKFGQCSKEEEEVTQLSTNGRCGDGYGRCPKGECCSKYGWCGHSDEHCATNNGCKTKYGICKSEIMYRTGECGKNHGKCSEGYCCSKFGWCGKTEQYCGKGCQSEFGECH